MVTNQDILDALTNLKNKDRAYFKPGDYKQFLPSAIPNAPAPQDDSLTKARMQAILDKSNSATLLSDVKHQNEVDYNQMVQAQANLNRAKGALRGANGQQAHGGGSAGSLASLFNVGPSKGHGGNGHLSNVGVGRNLAHFDWNGRKSGGGMTLNASVGNRFVNFLRALNGTGYNISSLGSYANRNIAGTSSKSLHAYGLAIDINPGSNPVTYGHRVTNLPKGVGRLAAKYGLVWGGNWNGPKYDTMHFSVPYGGRK